MSQVNIENIFKAFGKEQVLKNITFEIGEGERFGLIGPNGAGKSTLIDILTGLQRADEGSIMIDGMQVPQDISKIRAQLGLVPQEIALIPELHAKANLEYFGGLYGLSGNTLKERINESLEAVGLTDTNKKAVKSFSGGMQRRLNIAAAILHRPKLLILDEPTVGVDPQSRNKIFEFIKEMNERYGTTVLYTSHYMEEIEALCERVYILDQGQQVAYGTQEEIKMLVQDTVKWQIEVLGADLTFSDKIQGLQGVEQVITEENKYHLIVDPTQFKSAELTELIHQESVELVSLGRDELSLEEAFLQLTGKSLRD
ncbi:ABC transporter ATP-binding protein [Aerococcaceae bacterium DSM 111176]|nr:ABC transporter ATP-binding protein [Aerococcaceae bacterium DSM 111176]